MTDTKLPPIKSICHLADKKNRGWYDSLTADKRKKFGAWIMLRWLSTVQGKNAAHYLYFVNLFVNQNFSDVSKHPELQWLLMTACGTGKMETHGYVKPPTARKKKDRISEFLNDLYPLAKYDEIALLKSLNSVDDLKQLAKDNGLDDKEIKEIFK